MNLLTSLGKNHGFPCVQMLVFAEISTGAKLAKFLLTIPRASAVQSAGINAKSFMQFTSTQKTQTCPHLLSAVLFQHINKCSPSVF